MAKSLPSLRARRSSRSCRTRPPRPRGRSPSTPEIPDGDSCSRRVRTRREQGGSVLEDRFDLELELDLVGDHDTTGLEHGVEVDAEIGALDLASRGEARAGLSVGVRSESTELERER